jgi:hypothetical protein
MCFAAPVLGARHLSAAAFAGPKGNRMLQYLAGRRGAPSLCIFVTPRSSSGGSNKPLFLARIQSVPARMRSVSVFAAAGARDTYAQNQGGEQ